MSCRHIREYRYVYGAIELIFIPPYTPEMDPIEQIWKKIRKRGFKNEVFQTLQKVIDRLCDTICSLSDETIKALPEEIGSYPVF